MSGKDDLQVELELPFDDEPAVEQKTSGKEEKQAVIDGQSPEDGIAELKERLESEKRARYEAEQRAHQAQEQVQRASLEVQNSDLQLINGAIDKLQRESDYMKAGYRDAMQAGDYDRAAEIQQYMSATAAKLLQLENGKVSLEGRLAQPVKPIEPPRMDPVEQVAAQLSPRSAAWVRAHPQCVTDQRLYQKMVGAHNIAVADGYAPDSDDYFNYIENQMGFNRQAQADQGEEVILSTASKATQNRSAPPAAPSTRTASSTGGRTTTVRLTPEMKEMASMMGMTPEDYAKNMLDLKKEGKLS